MRLPRSERFWRRLTFLPDVPASKSAPTTWYRRPETWGLAESITALDIGPFDIYQPKPRGFRRSETLPVHPTLPETAFVFGKAGLPLLLQSLSYLVLPRWRWHWSLTLFVFHGFFVWFAVQCVARFHRFTAVYGTLNEENATRMLVPDAHVGRVAYTTYAAATVRVAGALYLCQDASLHPLEGLGLLTVPKIALWLVVLDYFFYCYHRSAHDPVHFPWLWKIHSLHHSTRAPTALQTILASDEQELIEVVVVPLLAWLVVPLSWPEQWLALCVLLYTEILGHTGIRAYWQPPLLGLFLAPFGLEGCIEDHDLHHRHGLSGKSFGKQSRIFDWLFGTCETRVERVDDDSSLDPHSE